MDAGESRVMSTSGDVHLDYEIAHCDCRLSCHIMVSPQVGYARSGGTCDSLLSYMLPLAAWIMPNTHCVYKPCCWYFSCIYGMLLIPYSSSVKGWSRFVTVHKLQQVVDC